MLNPHNSVSKSNNNIYSNIIDQMDIGVFWKDLDLCFSGANKRFCDYFGITEEELRGKTEAELNISTSIVDGDDENIIMDGKSYNKERVKWKNNTIILTKYPLYDNCNRIIGIAGYFIDITNTIGEIDKLKEECATDPLTKLRNRKGFEDDLSRFINDYETKHENFIMYMIDVDDFKKFNDTYGHHVGDSVLVSVASNLVDVFDANTSSISRIGGDEFAVLAKTSQIYDYTFGIQRINYAFKCAKAKEIPIPISASVGGAIYSVAKNRSALQTDADELMYLHKKKKKGVTNGV